MAITLLCLADEPTSASIAEQAGDKARSNANFELPLILFSGNKQFCFFKI